MNRTAHNKGSKRSNRPNLIIEDLPESNRHELAIDRHTKTRDESRFASTAKIVSSFLFQSNTTRSGKDDTNDLLDLEQFSNPLTCPLIIHLLLF